MPAGQRVLVVDDEEDIRAALSDFLLSMVPGIEVVTARQGAEAFGMMQKQAVDLIVSDYRMPVMDGLVFLERAHKEWPDVPAILVTAFADVQVALAAINAGHVRQLLTKPVVPEELTRVTKALLEERLARQQREAALGRAAKQGDDAGQRRQGAAPGR